MKRRKNGQFRRNAWTVCRRSARTAARQGLDVAACPYTSHWAAVWLRTFQEAQQQRLFA